MLTSSLEFLWASDKTFWRSCDTPDPYFMWKDEEKEEDNIEKMRISSNPFRLLVHCLNPDMCSEYLEDCDQYSKSYVNATRSKKAHTHFCFLDPSTGEYHLRDSEMKPLKDALLFFKVDQEELDQTPVAWEEIHSLRHLLNGVDVDSSGVQFQWSSLLGKVVRKNKIAMGIFVKPEDGIISLPLEDVRRLIEEMCRLKLGNNAKEELKLFQLFFYSMSTSK